MANLNLICRQVDVKSHDGVNVMSIEFPGKSMIDTKGNPISGSVDVYVTFGDAKNKVIIK